MLVVALLFFLVSISHSLDFQSLMFDDVSGDMIKPANWSDAKFQLVQQLRIKVRLRLPSSKCPMLKIFMLYCR